MRLRGDRFEIELCAGTAEHLPLLLQFIEEMAAFENLPVSATRESLQASLFGDEPAAKVLLAFDSGASSQEGTRGAPIGYATYFFSFATTVGKRGLWLDDLYVRPAFRGRGIGASILSHLAGIAIERDCARMEWAVLDWNEAAIGFYRHLGARLLPDWRVCRLEEHQLPGVAKRTGAK